MPNVNVSLRDMQLLVGKKFSLAEFKEAVLYAKSEVDSAEGDSITVEVKDSNRPDLLSAEGIARELRSRLTKERGIPKYAIKKSGVELIVDKSLAGIRPCIAAAIVKNVKVTEEFLVQMIQLQEKVCLTFGRKRKEAAIGLYDWSKLLPPMHYRAYKPREKKFVPLEYKVEMDLLEILQEHPTGREYAHLLQGNDRFPILEDSKQVVASMPPIINSQLTGKVSEATKELLVEVTGFEQETVNTALNVMVSALAERGFSIYSVAVRYPNKKIETPDFSPKKVSVKIRDIREFSGLLLSNREITELLQKARYEVKGNGTVLECSYPAYRQDILHPVDVIEDVLISYGYNKIEPLPIKLATVGKERQETRQIDLVREVCIGLGLQEVLTYTMTNKEKQAAMIGADAEKEQFVELANPVSENYTVFRKQLFPELLDFLAANKHVAYPQKIFELGKTVELEPKSETAVAEKNKLCIVLCGKEAEFTVIKSALQAIADHFGLQYELQELNNAAFVAGKSAAIKIGNKKGLAEGTISQGFFAEGKKGLLGEIEKRVLQNFGLQMPTAVLEIEV